MPRIDCCIVIAIGYSIIEAGNAMPKSPRHRETGSLEAAVDPLENFPGYLLRRVSATAIAELAKRLGTLALRPIEASVLLFIERNPGITQSEIGRLLDMARANMAPVAGRLQKRALTLRARVDGRSQGLTLSANGRRLAKEIRMIMTEHESALMSRIPESQRAAFIGTLRALWMPRAP